MSKSNNKTGGMSAADLVATLTGATKGRAQKKGRKPGLAGVDLSKVGGRLAGKLEEMVDDIMAAPEGRKMLEAIDDEAELLRRLARDFQEMSGENRRLVLSALLGAIEPGEFREVTSWAIATVCHGGGPSLDDMLDGETHGEFVVPHSRQRSSLVGDFELIVRKRKARK